MRKSIVLFLAGALVSSALASTAEGKQRAHHPTKYRFEDTGLQAIVQQSPDWPFSVGSTNVVAGVVTLKRTTVKTGAVRVAQGAYRHYDTVTGRPNPSTFAISGWGQTYFANGSSIYTYQGTIAVQPDLSLVVSASGKFVGGTGDERHARGSVTVTGSAPSPTAPITTHDVGTIRY